MGTARALLWSVVKHHRVDTASAVAWLVLLAAATGAYGLLAGPLVRALFGGRGTEWLRGWGLEAGDGPLWVPAAVVVVASVKAVATHFQAVTQARLGQRIVGRARDLAHRALLRQNPLTLPATGAGDLALRVLDDAERLEALVTTGLLGALRDGLQVVVLCGLCLALDPGMTALFFGAYPAAIVPLAILGRRVRRAAGTASEERGALANEIHQQLHRFPLLVAMGAEGWAARRVRTASEAVSVALLRGVRLRATVSPLMELLGAVALAFTVVYAHRRIEAGSLAPEAVSSFLAATLLLYQPVKNLTRLSETLAPGRVAAERLAALGTDGGAADQAPAAGEGKARPVRVTLTARELVVHHPGGDRPALRLPEAHFEPGRVTAVVGPNGAGKSTLCAVILGWLPPSAGALEVTGIDGSSTWHGERQRSIGWIPTAPMLARGTLRENVALGRRPIDAEAWRTLARLAGLEALVERLPRGWETPLQDGGEGLSSGEQRRVALARALYGEPPVLLFDEPEASLDDVAVTALASRLEELKAGRTVIVMTHDERLVRAADAVIHLTIPAPPQVTP